MTASAPLTIATFQQPYSADLEDLFTRQVYNPSRDPRLPPLDVGLFGIPSPQSEGNVVPMSLGARYNAAKALSAAGVVIDEEIDAEGWPPLATMLRRIFYGYKDWPSMAQALNVDPSTGLQTLSNPANLITVTIDPANAYYTPWLTKNPPAPTGAVSLIGPFTGATTGMLSLPGPNVNIYEAANKTLKLPTGISYTDPTTGLVYLTYNVGANLTQPGGQVTLWFLGPQGGVQ
jgi:hypothetical protein